MTNKDSERLTEEDKIKIQILLHEYNTLRAELIANGNKGFYILALSGALFVGILSRPIDIRFWVAVALGLSVIFFTTFAVTQDIRSQHERVKELENDINQRANEELLVWERRWSRGATRSFLNRGPLPSTWDTDKLNLPK